MQENAKSRPFPFRRASLFTLGCRLNQSETEALRDRLEALGCEIVPWGAPADFGVVNSCTVTRLAEAKCRQIVRGFVKANPEAFCAVVGCYSQAGAAALARIPGVDLIVGNRDKLSLTDFVGDGKKRAVPLVVGGKLPAGDFSVPAVCGAAPTTLRANLKVQDGCDFMCSYCIIPFARGRARSRDFSDLVAEAESLAARGAKEITLTGVNIGTYKNSGYDILGVVYLKDLFGKLNDPAFDVRSVARPAQYFHEDMDVYKALAQLRERHVHYGIVCDEFGATRGIVTYHDILEALLGDLPRIGEDPDIIARKSGGWLVDGGCSFYDFLEYFGMENLDGQYKYNSVSGLIVDLLERFPQAGDTARWNGFEFEIMDMDGARIDKLLVSRLPETQSAAGTPSPEHAGEADAPDAAGTSAE